jgi:predicted O-methyltransferase YrrM
LKFEATDFRGRLQEFAYRQLIRKSALNNAGSEIFERLLSGGMYRRVLEIGTYRGITAALMAQYVGHVTTIDLSHGKMQWDDQIFDRHKLWSALGAKNIKLQLVDNDAHKAALVPTLDFDFAYIDGDHTYRGVSLDFDLVRRCGAVLFHDCSPGTPVEKLVATLPQEQVTITDNIFAFWQCKA